MANRPIVVAALLLSAVTAARADEVDDFVRARMSAFKVPGLSLAVIRNGQLVKSQGYGFADRDKRIAAASDTVYKIGSVGKQFVAAAVLLLVQHGRISLDDRISGHLRGTPASWSAITIRHLLSHTSGLARESPAFTPFENRTPAELIAALQRAPLRFPPGRKWEYSNAGYIALAEIIGLVTRQPWTEYLDASLFTPAGMQATRPTHTAASVPNRAVGYTGDGNQRTATEWVAFRPSGAFLSTVVDLAKWDGLLAADTVLTEGSRRAMWTPVRLADRTTAPYGLGWHVESHRGRRRVWHGGKLPGFSAYYVRHLDDRLSVVVLSNADDVDIAAIGNGVAALSLRRLQASSRPLPLFRTCPSTFSPLAPSDQPVGDARCSPGSTTFATRSGCCVDRPASPPPPWPRSPWPSGPTPPSSAP